MLFIQTITLYNKPHTLDNRRNQQLALAYLSVFSDEDPHSDEIDIEISHHCGSECNAFAYKVSNCISTNSEHFAQSDCLIDEIEILKKEKRNELQCFKDGINQRGSGDDTALCQQFDHILQTDLNEEEYETEQEDCAPTPPEETVPAPTMIDLYPSPAAALSADSMHLSSLRHGGPMDDLLVVTTALQLLSQPAAANATTIPLLHLTGESCSGKGRRLDSYVSHASAAKAHAIEAISAELLALAAENAKCNGMLVVAVGIICSITCTFSTASFSCGNNNILVGAAWVGAFVLNVVAVSIPGRLDRIYSSTPLPIESVSDGSSANNCNDGGARSDVSNQLQQQQQCSHVKPWQSMFEPCGWAFAIWAPIYLLELLVARFTIGLSGVSALPPSVLLRVLPWWVTGHWLQALWCLVFRPAYKYALWLPAVCLLLAAATLLVAYIVLLKEQAVLSAVVALPLHHYLSLLVLRAALSMHGTWLLASALMVLNSWISTVSFSAAVSSDADKCSRAKRDALQLAVAMASALLLASVALGMSVWTRDPGFVATAAWALHALASRAQEKHKTIDAASSNAYELLYVWEGFMAGVLKCFAGSILGSHIVNFTAQ